MTPIALPQAIVRALRDPAPDAKDFTPTKFQPAASKVLFISHCVKFISADFPRHQFTKRFYGQLTRIIHRTARNRPRPPNTWARDFIAKNFIKQPIRIVVNDIKGLALIAHFS